MSYVFNPIVVDNVIYVLARNNSLVALDATTGTEIWIHEGLQGIAPRGINYWESKDRSDRRLLFQMNSYLQAIDAHTGKSIMTFGNDGVVNLREGLGREPATIVKTQSSNPGKVFENLIILGSAPGEKYMAPAGDLRAFDVVTGKLVWQFHTDSASRRVRLRDVAEGCVEVHRRRQHLGRDHRRSRARHRVLPARITDLRLLRRRPARRQSVRHFAGGARRAHRKAAVALPDGPSRSVGLRQRVRAAADDGAPGTARRSTSSRRRARPDSSTCSTASRASRCGPSKSGPCRRATSPASARGRRSRFRPRRRRSRRRRSRWTTSIRTS